MSWFFGKKKHKESPPGTPENESNETGEEFIIIEKRLEPQPSEGGDASSETSLYPRINNLPYPPGIPSSGYTHKNNSALDNFHYLNGIPFKLCKQLERSMNEDLEIDRLRVEEIQSFIARIKDENYEYDFNNERSIAATMENDNGED